MERGSLPVEREPPAPGDAKPAGHEMRQVRVLVGSGETSSHSHWLKKEKREKSCIHVHLMCQQPGSSE